MTIDCCLITTNTLGKLPLLENCTSSLAPYAGLFSQKIMSVDLFPGGAPLEWYDRFRRDGWTVLSQPVAPRGSITFNQNRVIARATSDLILYVEDDIRVRALPALSTMQKLFTQGIIRGRKAGFVCFNTHVFKDFTQNPPHIMDSIHNLENYITVDGDVFFVKTPVIQDKYYLNFPMSLFPKHLVMELLAYGRTHKVGWAMEHALTSAWFETGTETDYAVLISVQPRILADIRAGSRITVQDFSEYANINFWNNDEKLRHPEMPGRRHGDEII